MVEGSKKGPLLFDAQHKMPVSFMTGEECLELDEPPQNHLTLPKDDEGSGSKYVSDDESDAPLFTETVRKSALDPNQDG